MDTPPTLPELAAFYLDQRQADIGEAFPSKRTGEIRYRRTAKHFAHLVALNCSDYSQDEAFDAYAVEQERHKEFAQNGKSFSSVSTP